MTRQELADSFAINLEKERIDLGYSQPQMAKALGISPSSYKRIVSGETAKIDLYIIYRMYKLTNKLGYELGWTMDPYLDMFDKVRQLSESQLRFIGSIVDFELDFTAGLADEDLPEDYITVLIPTGNMQDGMIYDSSFFQKMNIAPYRRRYGSLIDCGIQVTSSHLSPVYHAGDVLLISRQPTRDGDTGIFIDRSLGLAYVRKFYASSPNRLEPVNHYGSTIYVDSSCEEEMNRWIHFGRVVTKTRT